MTAEGFTLILLHRISVLFPFSLLLYSLSPTASLVGHKNVETLLEVNCSSVNKHYLKSNAL